MTPDQAIAAYFTRHVRVIEATGAALAPQIAAAAEQLQATLQRGGKILIAGNGGSAADAQHFAAELAGRFLIERRALAALALTTDSSILTAVGNDYGFDSVFSRQIEALARPGDLFFAISTSGNSPNILAAVDAARALGCRTIALTGRDGGALANRVDLALTIPAAETPHIQEGHATIIHLLCQLVDQACCDGRL